MTKIRVSKFNVDSGARGRRAHIRFTSRGRNAAVLSTVALASSPCVFAQTTSENDVPAAGPPITEVVVTAQRRTQTVQDIPYNISAVTGSEISASGAVNINDLSRIVNGLVTVDQGPAARSFQNDLTLRGLRTDAPGGGSGSMYKPSQTVNSVSTYFGETPIFFPMVLADIERVEVLRGPQGTLYGSGAQAGTIRVIPQRPNLSVFAGEVSATGSSTQHADDMNGNIRGMMNAPLSDTLAVRVVAGYERLAGFIDAVNLWAVDTNQVPIPSVPGNLSSGPVVGPRQDDVNTSDQWFARGALRWKPLEAIDVQFDYLHQETTQDSPQVSTPFWRGGCIDYSAADAAASTSTCDGAPASAFYANAGGRYVTAAVSKEPYDDSVDLMSLVADIDLGFANLTSATSYFEAETGSSVNFIASNTGVGSGFNFAIFAPYYGYPRANFITDGQAENASFVQEVRLASNGENFLDYVVGAFYLREQRESSLQFYDYGLNAFVESIGEAGAGDVQGNQFVDNVYSDAALFGELTAHITEAWQVTGGLRFFRDKFTESSSSELPLCGAICSQDSVDPRGRTALQTTQKFSDHLMKLNTSYDLATNTKVYATYAEGFRRGGTNRVPITGPLASLPEYQTYNPDTAKNYEVGIKGDVVGGRLRYSAALYRIDLTDVQLNAYSPSGFASVYNGGRARTRGAELEMKMAISGDLSVTAGYTYTEAETTESVSKSDLVFFALIPEFGGNGPTDTTEFLTLPKGASLPGVPRHSGTLGIDYTMPLAMLDRRGQSLLLHADAVYRGSAAGALDETRPFYWTVPTSTVINLRGSLRLNEHVDVDIFANNLTSETAYSGAAYAQNVQHPYQLRNVARPRTVGLTVKYRY